MDFPVRLAPQLQMNKRTFLSAYKQHNFPLLQSWIMFLHEVTTDTSLHNCRGIHCINLFGLKNPRFKSQSCFVWPKTGKSSCWGMSRMKVPTHGNFKQPGLDQWVTFSKVFKQSRLSCLLIAFIMVSSTSAFFQYAGTKLLATRSPKIFLP